MIANGLLAFPGELFFFFFFPLSFFSSSFFANFWVTINDGWEHGGGSPERCTD